MLTRREWLFATPFGSLVGACLADLKPAASIVRFGVIADVHHDVMPDGPARVAAFSAAMNASGVDFVIQLGDFCVPKPENAPCLAAFDRFAGPHYHVLGNHDMDGGFSREQAAKFLGMPARYYAFERAGIRFLVLDGNEPGGNAKGYKRFIGREQLDWLSGELARPDVGPAVVLVHQPLDRDGGVENQADVRAVLKAANEKTRKVLAVLCGHFHADWEQTIDGIPHIQINSASYFWMGEKFAHESYDAEIHRRHPSLKSTCPYRDPLWALVTIDLGRGVLSVDGRSSTWVGHSPWELGATAGTHDPHFIRPAITGRRVAFSTEVRRG